MLSVAIVHDYVVERGGSERVLLSMHRAFPDAPVHTAFYRPHATFPEFTSVPMRPFSVNRVALLREHHRAALPILPFVFGRTRVDADVVLCGTSGWSAGVRATGRKVLYVHAPTRWLNDQDAFLEGRSRVERLGLRLVERPLRRWDAAAMLSGDCHLVGSTAMAAMLRAVYGVTAAVLPPPVTIDPDGEAVQPPGAPAPGFLLCAGRLVANKKVASVIDAMRRRPDDCLVVAGSGPELERLRAGAPANVAVLGQVDDRQMRWLLANCRAAVSAAHESFGLAAVEAAAFGRPVAALGHGGSLDTVVDGATGVFFDRPDPAAIADALDRLDALHADADALRAHAGQWSEANFVRRLRDVVGSGG